ncbi:MAG: DegT/DnrJ/EryC1/StrS aminotransferase family protein [Planctomycetaceae bacterium]|nr:DegT/DnrJ/EryC1/StrS aminotransferase family protein [Planctomycetaceae bacterium]
MLSIPFSNWPAYSEEEGEAVRKLLLSNQVNYWTGDEGRKFEKEFASWTDCDYAIALANGTVAIDLALKALSIGHGDEVIVTPRSFIASVSCVVNAGAIPVFADVDADSQNLTAASIEASISSKTRAVIVVHLAGWPCEMDKIVALCQKYNIYLVEDCAQAHGAKYNNRSVGSFGHVGCWSFCQDKIMTTAGEGGMVTTNDRDLWSRMWSYKDHGKNWESVYEHNHPPGFRWIHDSFGTNWRMTEIQAAIGRIQLRHMDEWTRLRQLNSNELDTVLRNFESVRVPRIPDYICHARYKHYVFVEPDGLADGWSRDRIIEELKQLEIPCYQGSCSEVYLEKAFDNTTFRPAQRLRVARELGETSLMFLVHPTLLESEIGKTCTAIEQVMSRATR